MNQPTPIQILGWSPAWAQAFEREAARIRRVAPGLMLHHIGSTTIKDCPAKPTIDIMAVFSDPDPDTYASMRQQLVAELGYVSLGPYGVEGRSDFLSRYDADFFHISVFSADSEHVAKNLYFRDRLNEDAVARNRYVELKRALTLATPDDLGAYNVGKSALVSEFILGRWSKGTLRRRLRVHLELAAGSPSTVCPRRFRE